MIIILDLTINIIYTHNITLNTQIFTLIIMNKVLIQAIKITNKVTIASIGFVNHLLLINRMFHYPK